MFVIVDGWYLGFLTPFGMISLPYLAVLSGLFPAGLLLGLN